MQYDTSIDVRILTALSKSNTRHFNNLYETVKKSEKGKIMSRSVFTFHLNKLMNDGIVGKHDEGQRGTRVYYFLTDSGKQQYRFYPSNELEKKERFGGVYQLLFFFVSKYHDKGISYRLDSEEEFENFLSKIHISREDLVVDSVRYDNSGGMYPVDKKMYQSRTITEFKLVSGVKIWKEDHYGCTWFSLRAMNIDPYGIHHKRTYKITYDARRKILLKYVRKKEIDEEIATGREKVKVNDFSRYYYTLPVGGVSVSDVVNHKDFVFEHGGFTPEEVQKAVDLLKQEDIIRPTKVLFGETRYSFNPTHEPLKELLNEYWDIQHSIFAKMNRIWRYIRKPTSDERRWLELFYGEKRAGEMLRGAYHQRHSYRPFRKYGLLLEKMLKTFTDMSKEDREEIIQNTTIHEREKIIKDLKPTNYLTEYDIQFEISVFDKDIKKMITKLEGKYARVIQKYSFPLKRLRDMIYPEYIQNAP